MTIEEQIQKLDKRHHHFECVPDPWHLAVLMERYPHLLEKWANGLFLAGAEAATGQATLHAGPLMHVWFSVDAQNNLLGEWGFDAPPADVVVLRGA